MRDVKNGAIVANEVIWRYFRFERFISLLKSGQLYFASANQFPDLFEGAVAVQVNLPPPDPRYAEMEPDEHAFFELKRLTKINCWHRATYESDAMWKLYAGEHKGIAICSTPDRISAAIKPFRFKPEYGVEDLWAGPVQYLDLTQVRMKALGSPHRFFFKHRAFEWEKEFRLAISLEKAEMFAVPVPEDGILVEVDLGVMVDRIVLGSTTPPNERAITTDNCEHAGLSDRLELSTLLGKPRYI